MGVIRQFVRAGWRSLTPYRLMVSRKAERAAIKLRATPDRWFRTPWPNVNTSDGSSREVAIVIANYNTAEKLSMLLFSLFRILGLDNFCRIVVVDNASTDSSPGLLRKMQDAGLLTAILNCRQRYHGPALNQAINYLAKRSSTGSAREARCRYIWVLDSDTIVLRSDVVAEAVRVMENTGAGVIGQLQYDVQSLPGGYAHVCSLFMDPCLVWRRRIEPFQESGTPAEGLQLSLVRHGIAIVDFPFMRNNFVLHLGASTVATLASDRVCDNRYYGWAKSAAVAHFHGNTMGPQLLSRYAAIYKRHVPDAHYETLIRACRERTLLDGLDI